MTERAQVVASTQMAMLNAIILSLLSIQFIVPFAFILLIWIVPTIIALQVYHVPLKLMLLSGLVIIGLSFILFGIDVGFWMVVYISAGSVLGISRKLNYHWSFRLLSVAFAFTVSLLAIMIIFGWLTQISWQEIQNVLAKLSLFNQIPLLPAMVGGLITWTVIISVVVDWFLSRVLRQLHIGVQ